MTHIIVRFCAHFAASAFVLLAFFFALRFWIVRNNKVYNWISPEKQRLLLTCALLVASIFPLREPFDLWAGNNSIIKTYFDIASWDLGAAVSAWLLYRFWRSK